ncbi:Plant Basic Secretory Protein [compost metagenome]
MFKIEKIILFTLLTMFFFACSSKKTVLDIPKDGGPKGPVSSSDYVAAPVKEINYDNNLNELYVAWDGADAKWDTKSEYIGAEFEFYTLLSSKKVQRRMIPNLGFFGALTVRKRDYNNEPSTLRLSKYRSVLVTPNAGIDEVRYRSIYKNTKGEEQRSNWVLLKDRGVVINKSYSASDYFMKNVTNPVQISFTSASSKPVNALWDLVGGGDEAKAKNEFKKWYYMQVSATSFDPFNLAFDPYSKLDILIADDVGVANAIDFPNHSTGRRINYEASVKNPNSDLWKLFDMQGVMLHEMGHCIQWMPKGGKYKKTSGTQTFDCDRQGYQEGWPDAGKIANKGYIMSTQVREYKTAMQFPYENPTDDKRYVWQIDYNTSGAFMSWLRQYNGDFVRLLPWTVLMDELTDTWSLDEAVKVILANSYPDKTMKDLWEEYREEVNKFIVENGG